jgi:hypothetical protein
MPPTVSPTKTSDIQLKDPRHESPMMPRATGRWIGALFLAAFALYGLGGYLIEQATGPGVSVSEILASESQIRTGALLVVANSIAIVAIGGLMYRLATAAERHVRLAYLGARVFEGVFLALTAVFGLAMVAAAESGSTNMMSVLAEGGKGSYQIAMIGLSAGSIPLFWALARSQAMPRRLGLWGVVGYAIFGAGAALELFDVSAGVLLSIPGGIFEVTFAVYLLWKGVLGPSTEARRS